MLNVAVQEATSNGDAAKGLQRGYEPAGPAYEDVVERLEKLCLVRPS